MSFDEAAALANANNLQRVDRLKPFFGYLRECWSLRHFTFQFAISKIIASTVQNRLGMFWEFLTPLLMSAMYYLSFGVLLGTRHDSKNFIFFLIAGVLTFYLFLNSFTSSAMSLLTDKELAGNLLFPRVLIPVAAGLQALMRALPTLSLLYPIAWLTGCEFHWIWLLLPFQLMLVVMLGLGMGLMVSRAVVKVRDIAQALPLLNRVLMFTSGIFYSVSIRFAHTPDAIRVVATNSPIAIMLDSTRGLFIREDRPTSIQVISVVIGTFILVLIGLVMFWRGERRDG